MPINNNTLGPDGRRQKKKEREGETETESAVDVHLSCIIAANASAAILALETM